MTRDGLGRSSPALTPPPANIDRRRVLIGAVALSMAALPDVACAQQAQAAAPAKAPVAIEVEARPIVAFDTGDRTHLRFGSLQYRSGLILSSKFSGFGGLSGLRLDPKGERFISMSDKGTWFTGRIVYRSDVMTGLADVEAAPMLAADGKPLAARGWYDTESIALDGPLVYIGIERVNQIVRFDFGKDGIRALAEVVPTPPGIRKLPNNKGLESLVVVPKGMPLAGTLIAISERGLDDAGNLVAFLIGGPTPGQFSIRRSKDFDISDAVLLPSGDLLILERKFSLLSGLVVRIRRMPLKSVVPGATIDGPSIFDADLGYEIDNLEGIDAHIGADGSTVLTMISDDNFSMIQRTVLLQFTLVDE
jgi:hypothetical protein